MDNLFFISSKILWLIISPENLIVIALFATFILFLSKKLRLAKKFFYVTSSTIFIIALFPIGSWLIYPLETQFPAHPNLPEKIDGIILLGGSFNTSSSQAWGKVQTNNFADRIHSFIALKYKYPNAKAIFTGGIASVNSTYPTEAFFAQKLFNDMGLEDEQILYESKARNSYENIIYAKRLALPKQGENWIVVSSAFHLPRTVGIFCQQNWPIIPYPADFHSNPDSMFMPELNLSDNLNLLNYAIHEWIGLIAYHLTGKTTEWLPQQCT